MKLIVTLSVLLICFAKHEVTAVGLPGPLVYVVTPSPRTPLNEEGRSVPFYYHNWMKRMDTPLNVTTTTTQKTKTPDLIFAEFESDNNNKKSIRKLLENEKIVTTTSTTTSRPIYIPDEGADDSESGFGTPVTTTEEVKKPDMTDYFAYYNNLYNTGEMHSPVYVPPGSSPTSALTTQEPPVAKSSQNPMGNVEDIWHIIDSEKYDQNSEKWEEQSIGSEETAQDISNTKANADGENSNDDKNIIDDNFAIPGFGTNPGNGAENESRAIRTESNIRFPYINLKPFQVKSSKIPMNTYSKGNSNNNMFNLDSFQEMKNPARGEAQDVIPMRQSLDRYNPAQPYLPQQPSYGSKSKQPSPSNPQLPPPPSPPVRAVANLVPPPPPPKLTADDFPTPSTYESFPPYAPAVPAPSPVALNPPISMYRPTVSSGPDSSEDSGPDNNDAPSNDSDSPLVDIGYRYKPPAAPVPFIPTLPPPPSKPFSGYSYDKPSIADSPPSMMDMGSKPEFQGYDYSKPKPSSPPDEPSYGVHGSPPSYGHSDDHDDAPPSSYAGPHGDDSGFPHDFPGDFKFHNDFDDHDHDFHHHHHHTTTTTTTEMPRVNRYSYYYLGKKLYYLPLYFSVYFIVYVGALIIKAVLRHKITYPNSWRPNDQTASFFSKRSLESHLSNENLHEITGRVTRAIATAANRYMEDKSKKL